MRARVAALTSTVSCLLVPTDAYAVLGFRSWDGCVGLPYHTALSPTVSPASSARSQSMRYGKPFYEFWEGDDLRWTSRVRRKISSGVVSRTRPVMATIVTINILMYLYQTSTNVAYIASRHPEYWPKFAISMCMDSLLGASKPGPLTLNLAHVPLWSQVQPHRYLTAGFIHGGILHLICNIDALRRTPAWLERGLGAPIFLTTYLLAIIGGSCAHSLMIESTRSLCVGASGGICGLYGLMYIALLRMGNGQAARRVARGMAWILVYGVLVTNISNAAHLGGFVMGSMVGLLCGPRYEKNYAARRKWSLDVDSRPRDYQAVIPFGTRPSNGIIPVKVIWLMLMLASLLRPDWRAAPGLALRALIHPGYIMPVVV